MYTKRKQIINSKENLCNYIDGIDIYGSLLASKLADPTIPREFYTVLVNQYRPDLIAEDYYGSSNYMGILLLQGGMGLSGYYKGATLELIPKDYLDYLLTTIDQ